MSYQQPSGSPQNQSQFGPHGFGPHGNYGFQPNQNNYQNNQPFFNRKNGPGFNPQQQNGFPFQKNNFYPPHGGNFPPQGAPFQYQFQQPQPQPESCHEHQLNFEGRLDENCKICLKKVGENGGYKCKECPIVLCLNCSQKIFYGNKKKQIHQHDLILRDRNSWTCDSCKTSYMDNASFFCEKCDFDVCDKCYIEENQPQPQFPQLQPPSQQQGPYPQPQYAPSQTIPQPPYQQQGPYPQPSFQQQGPYPQPPFQGPGSNMKPPFPQQGPYPLTPFPQQPQEQYQPGQVGYVQQQSVNQSQGGFQPYQGEKYPAQQNNYQTQDGYQQQNQENGLEPESEHEHPLNFEQSINEFCKLCSQNIGNREGYKCKECPIVLCLNCSDRIFYGNKNKTIHQHELFLKNKINSWNCNICRKPKAQSASFSCTQCNFDICDECYMGNLPQGYQPQQGVNPQQYPIQQDNQPMKPAYAQTQQQTQEQYESFHEHPLNYEEKLNSNCKICLKKQEGNEGYICKDCPLVLCMNCLNSIYYGSKKKSLHKHDLILKNRANWRCDICKKKNGDASFYCTECDFDACHDCYLGKSQEGSQTNNQYQPITILESESSHEHPLNYQEKLKDTCKICLKSINNEKGYKCEKCPMILCFDCSNIIKKPKKKSIHNHDLLLQTRKRWRCNLCKKEFKNKSSFYCKECDYDACVNCFTKN